MDLVTLGINGLLLMAIWRFALKKSILDHHRDELFDLRDELRAEFIARGWAMDSQLYKRLRDLINGYLRFTDRFSLLQVVLMENQFRDNETLRAVRKQSIDAKFETTDQEQERYVRDLRRRALSVVMNYMIVSSGPLVLATVLLVPFVLLHLLIKAVLSLLHAGGTSIASAVGNLKGLLDVTVQLAAALLAEKLLMKDFVEKCSYEQVA